MRHSNRAIIVVEDDEDDIELITEAHKELELTDELQVLRSGFDLYDYLTDNPAPFFIICDYHLPAENAITIMNRLLSDREVRYKSVPFIIWSTSATEKQIKDAYDNLIQGFFVKPPEYAEIKNTIQFIVEYWQRS